MLAELQPNWADIKQRKTQTQITSRYKGRRRTKNEEREKEIVWCKVSVVRKNSKNKISHFMLIVEKEEKKKKKKKEIESESDGSASDRHGSDEDDDDDNDDDQDGHSGAEKFEELEDFDEYNGHVILTIR